MEQHIRTAAVPPQVIREALRNLVGGAFLLTVLCVGAVILNLG